MRKPVVPEAFEHGDPSWGPGQRSFAWSPDGTRIAFNRNEGGFGRLCIADVATGEVEVVAKGVHGALSWQGDHLAAIRSGARTPTEIVVYDDEVATGAGRTRAGRRLRVGHLGRAGARRVGRRRRQRRARSPLPSGDVRDGQRSSAAHLLDPRRAELDRVVVLFNARWAYWIDRGMGGARARPSRLDRPRPRVPAGDARPMGDLDTSDVAAGLRAAAERGWADPKRMVVMGGSAGGFTVLNVLAHHPDLCAAGVDLYGVADLLEPRRDDAPLREALPPLDRRTASRRRRPIPLARRCRSSSRSPRRCSSSKATPTSSCRRRSHS